MNLSLNNRIEELEKEMVGSLQKLLRIKSVETEEKEGMPFGEGVNQALEEALNLASILGLKTRNVDGYCGHAEIGQGDEILGILCHLDVVPEGKNWTYPPFGGEVHDGKIYGRGSIDNKGPAVAALYALKAIKDCGIELKKRVRVILGTDEESGWKDLEYYFKKEDTPDIAFSPDAEYPVIHGEKGVLTFKLKGNPGQRGKGSLPEEPKVTIKEIKGGNAPNMVPDYSRAVLETDYGDFIRDELQDFVERTGYQLEYSEEEGFIILESHGVSAHGSTPREGKNAISQLLLFLTSLDIIKGEMGDFLDFYCSNIGMECDGKKLGCYLEDEVSGGLTLNVGMINIDENKAEVVINIRYPVTFTQEDVFAGIREKLAGTGIELEEGSHMAPLYVPKDDPLVKKLMRVYQEFTGDDREPITIGGGTYARAINKAVAFGPLFPGQEELAHQKDEYISIDDLVLNAKIYAQAIIALATEEPEE